MISRFFLQNSIAKIHKMVTKKEISFSELAKITIENVCKLNDKFNVWTIFDEEILLQEAKKLDKDVQSHIPLKSLSGMPVGVKDIINTHEFSTQMGSPLWKDFMPGNDARIVYYLKNAGGIIPGKTVTAEFAVHSLVDKTMNPHDESRTPGTSSSGSAVSIALGMVPVSLGTQTAGSIIRPASFCGIYGCKPSFGLIPRTGMLKTTDSLDTVGYFVSCAEDLRRVFDVLRVHGANFPKSFKALHDSSRQNKSKDRPWKVAFVKTHTWCDTSEYAKDAIENFIKKLDGNGDVTCEVVELPASMNKSHEIHETIYNKTLSYYFKEEYNNSELVSPIMNTLIEAGNLIPIERYQEALLEQEKMAFDMDVFFEAYDIILCLSTAGEAPSLQEMEKPDSALMWTMTHLCSVSVPAFVSPSGMPFGLQVVGRRYNDYLLFNFIDYLNSIGLVPLGSNPGTKFFE